MVSIVPVRLSNKDHHFLSIALKVAENSECRVKHGAVFVKNGNVLAIGVNKSRNHPNILGPFIQHNASRHAEIVAGMRMPPDKLRGSTLYSARVLRDGTAGLARPCPNCQDRLDRWGVKKIVFTS